MTHFVLVLSNLLRVQQDAGVLASNPPTTPIFRFNASAFAVKDIFANTPTFRTRLALFSPSSHQSSLIYYPFDVSVALFVYIPGIADLLTRQLYC
jgi:hypothetical protein